VREERVIDIEIGVVAPELRLWVPASGDSVPVVRQALRSLGDAVAARREPLEDAELAVSEACANAVEHAYPQGHGTVIVTLRPGEEDLHVSVRDYGVGMPADARGHREGRGFGLPLIEGMAREVHISNSEGTVVAMAFGMGPPEVETVDGGAPGTTPAERILRRLVAVVGAQADMPTDRLMEALLVSEIVARHALAYLVGDRVHVRFTRAGEAFELRVGPLEANCAEAVVADSEVPVIGPLVSRLADEVRVERGQVEGVECEYLALRLGPRR
jgi:serine/threonine-protein kinase RsbW